MFSYRTSRYIRIKYNSRIENIKNRWTNHGNEQVFHQITHCNNYYFRLGIAAHSILFVGNLATSKLLNNTRATHSFARPSLSLGSCNKISTNDINKKKREAILGSSCQFHHSMHRFTLYRHVSCQLNPDFSSIIYALRFVVFPLLKCSYEPFRVFFRSFVNMSFWHRIRCVYYQ